MTIASMPSARSLPAILALVAALPANAAPDPATQWAHSVLIDPILEPDSAEVRQLLDLVFAGGSFFATLDNGAVWASPDGATWTHCALPATDRVLESITADPATGTYLALLRTPWPEVKKAASSPMVTSPTHLVMSTDGTTWTVVEALGDQIASLAHGNGRWVVEEQAAWSDTAGFDIPTRMFISDDLANWQVKDFTTVPTETEMPAVVDENTPWPLIINRGIHFKDGRFHTLFWGSDDGITWELEHLPTEYPRAFPPSIYDRYHTSGVDEFPRITTDTVSISILDHWDTHVPITPSWYELKIEKRTRDGTGEPLVETAYLTSQSDYQFYSLTQGTYGAGRFVLAGYKQELLHGESGWAPYAVLSESGWIKLLSYEHYAPTPYPVVDEYSTKTLGPAALTHITHGNDRFVALDASGVIHYSQPVAEDHPFWGETWLYADGWKQLPAQGWIWDGYANWSYHCNIGWIWHGNTPEEGMWFQIAGLGWVRSTPELFPWVKWNDDDPNAWYLLDLTTYAPTLCLWHYNDATGWTYTDQQDL